MSGIWCWSCQKNREHLAFLPQVDSTVVPKFEQIVGQIMRQSSNPKVYYEGVTRKLIVGSKSLPALSEGLIYLLVEGFKLMISELDFQNSAFVLGLPDELNVSLLQFELGNRNIIRLTLNEFASDAPSYHSMEQRLEIQLASRRLWQQIWLWLRSCTWPKYYRLTWSHCMCSSWVKLWRWWPATTTAWSTSSLRLICNVMIFKSYLSKLFLFESKMINQILQNVFYWDPELMIKN